MSTLSRIDVPKGKHVLRILDNTGHTDVIYDPRIDDEVKEAMATFDESMAKGMRAFRLDENGGGELIHEFEETAPQIVVSPQYVGG